jgi:hypothetical protein
MGASIMYPCKVCGELMTRDDLAEHWDTKHPEFWNDGTPRVRVETGEERVETGEEEDR